MHSTLYFQWFSRLVIPISAVLTLFFFASPAHGQVRVAIVEVSLDGDLTDETEEAVTTALATGLRPAASRVLMPAEVSSEGAAAPGGQEPGAGADALLRATVVQLEQHYTVELELLLERDQSLLARSALECSACTWNEALSTMTRAANGITASLPGFLMITVSPPGAIVTIDGEERQASRLIALRPGAHSIEARLEGFRLVQREIAIVSTVRDEVSISLVPDEHETTEGANSPLRVAAWLTGIGALAALVPGVLWLSVDGQCPVDWDDAGYCPEVYDTWPQGLALTITGAALLSTSIALFISSAVHRRRARRVSLTLLPTPRGPHVAVSALF